MRQEQQHAGVRVCVRVCMEAPPPSLKLFLQTLLQTNKVTGSHNNNNSPSLSVGHQQSEGWTPPQAHQWVM